jgi:hypothetical protein
MVAWPHGLRWNIMAAEAGGKEAFHLMADRKWTA